MKISIFQWTLSNRLLCGRICEISSHFSDLDLIICGMWAKEFTLKFITALLSFPGRLYDDFPLCFYIAYLTNTNKQNTPLLLASFHFVGDVKKNCNDSDEVRDNRKIMSHLACLQTNSNH